MYFTARALLLAGDPRFLVGRLLATPGAELRKLDLPLNLLLILVRIIIPPFADGAFQRD